MKDLEFAKVFLTPDILEILPGKSCIRDDSIMDDHIMLSGKMQALDSYLHSYDKAGNKVLIFSYSTNTLNLIEKYVRGKGYTFLRLDGSVPTCKRQSLIDQFQTDKGKFLFLISTKAGGLGLNLTAANRVIIYDVNWNPSLDEQAQDRAYRIGQVDDVEVIRLVSRGTIEEIMYARQLYKVQLTNQTLDVADGPSVSQPRLFIGIDKHTKGELFGVENLLKYKDGSFMSELWKSNGKGGIPTNSKLPVAISTEKVVEYLGQFTEEQIMNLGSETVVDVIPDFDSDNYVDEDEQVGVDDTVIRHENFFREDLGAAVHDDEFMGGETQMDLIACDMAINNLDAHSEGCDDEDDRNRFGYKPAVEQNKSNQLAEEERDQFQTASCANERVMERSLPSLAVQESNGAENRKARSTLVRLPGYMKRK